MAAYIPKEGVKHINKNFPGHPLGGTGKKTKYGQIIESSNSAGHHGARMAGYASEGDMQKALRRHEIKHSITASKRGYTGHQRIRDLVSDEIGAYSRMGRGAKGGSKILRAINNTLGVGISTAIGLKSNTVLKARLKTRLKQAAIGVAAVGTAAIAAKNWQG